MAFAFVEENNASRMRLETLLGSLTDEELAFSTSYGWTVSALLAHLAFWDNRVLALTRRWKDKGIDESPVDSEAMNEALKPLCLAMERRTAVQLCLSSARAVDAELEILTADFVQEIEASPTFIRFNRGLHRNDHLNDIEKILGRPPGA